MDRFSFDQLRYLTSKKTVDDRALNRTVWQSLLDAVAEVRGDRLEMAELGAGTGSMLQRLLEWGFFDHVATTRADRSDTTHVLLDLIDNHGPSLARARAAVPALARANGWDHAETSDGWRLRHGPVDLELRFALRDIRELVGETRRTRYDVLLAHAFLDLFHLPTIVPAVLRLLHPGGLFYFTINYDGETIFEPAVDRALDEAVRRAYNRSMDERIVGGEASGDSEAGRHLFHVVTACDAWVLDLGSSDWVVFPRSGDYAADEEYFLRSILWLVGQALLSDPALPSASLDDWLRQRESQIRSRELIYIAHQVDILGRTADPASARSG